MKITDGSHFSPKIIGDGLPYITVRDVDANTGKIDFLRCKKIAQSDFEELSKNGCAPQQGDVLFSKDGTVGKVSLIENKKSFVVLSSLAIIRPDQTLLYPKYLAYVFKSRKFLNDAIGKKTGVAIRRIVLRNLKTIRIQFPALDKQKRIVEVLDAAFAKIDRLEVIAKRNIENAEDLLASGIESLMDDSCVSADIVSLSSVCDFENGDRGKNYPSKKYQIESGIPFINAGHIDDGYINFEKMNFISQERYDLLGNGKTQENDVLFCLRGSLGKFGRVVGVQQAAIASSLVIVRAKENLLVDYLENFFRSASCQKQIEQYAGGAAQPNLSAKSLKAFKIRLPNMAIQKRICTNAAQQKEKLENYVKEQTQKLAAFSELRQSLLQKAFAGELVDMDDAASVPALISLPTANENHTDHAGAIAYADSYFRNAHAQTFKGKTTYEKVAQAAESIAGIELGRQAFQGMRGPTDNQQRQAVEALAKKEGYFSFLSTGGKGFELKRGRKFNELRLAFEQKYQEQIPALDRFLRVIANMDTQDVEVLSTIHTAWNNYIIEGQTPTDEQIVTAAREGWHEEKTKIPRPKFFAAIKTLRDKNLVPTGLGKYVGKTAGASLEF